MVPHQILKEFDAFLLQKGQKFEAIVIGGAALSILGIITRETRDVDVLHPGIPLGSSLRCKPRMASLCRGKGERTRERVRV